MNIKVKIIQTDFSGRLLLKKILFYRYRQRSLNIQRVNTKYSLLSMIQRATEHKKGKYIVFLK